MNKYSVRRYETTDKNLWNSFVSEAKNATFLLDRNFMEYHANRFLDFSLLVFNHDKLIAVLPANRVGATVYSHQGLTYGGLIYTDKIKLSVVLAAFEALLKFLCDVNVESLHIKMVPSIYHTVPAEELHYAVFIANSKLTRRDSLSVLDLRKLYKITKTRLESIRRGKKNALTIVEEPNFALFWNEILIPNLSKKHNAAPVHSVEEIEMLHARFPNNIRHFNVYNGATIVAGTTVFVSDQVAHPQYVSGNSEKNELGALDYLYHYLITEVFAEMPYFDFGISNENQGRNVNEGLLFWKESFGAQILTQDFYEVPTANYKLLQKVLL